LHKHRNYSGWRDEFTKGMNGSKNYQDAGCMVRYDGVMIRSALAILARIVVLTVTSFAIEAAADPLLLHLFPHVLPNRAAMSHNLPATLLQWVYTAWCIATGGYVTAWLARRREALHAVIMGGIELALTVWAMVSLPNEAPLRNWIVGMALIVPGRGAGDASDESKSGIGATPRELIANFG